MSDTVTPVSLRPGEARCPGPSTRDLILGDSTPPPAPLLVESYDVRRRRRRPVRGVHLGNLRGGRARPHVVAHLAVGVP